MIVFSLLLAFLLVNLGYSKFSPLSPLNVSLTEGDTLQVNASSLFTHGGVGFTCLIDKPAEYHSNFAPFKVIDLNSEFKDAQVMKFLTNTSFFAVFDDNKFYYQQINNWGNGIIRTWKTTATEVDKDSTCSDAVYNEHLGKIFVACHTKPGAIVANPIGEVIEVDPKNGNQKRVVVYNQIDHGMIKYKLHIVSPGIPDPDNKDQIAYNYLFLMDPLASIGSTTHNRWVTVLKYNIQDDSMANLGTVNLDDVKNLAFATLNNLFSVKQKIVLVGTLKTGGVFTMKTVDLTVSNGKAVLTADEKDYPAFFGSSSGYVGVLNTGEYVEYTYDPNGVERSIHKCDFITEEILVIDANGCSSNEFNSTTDSHSLVPLVFTGNAHQIVIQYFNYNRQYGGYTWLNYDMPYKEEKYGPGIGMPAVFGKSVIFVDPDTVQIFRSVPPFFYIDAHKLKTGENVLNIKCTDDDDVNGVNNTITVNYNAKIMAGAHILNHGLGDVSGYPGHPIYFGLSKWGVKGNDLKITLDFDIYEEDVKSVIYRTEKLHTNYVLNQGINDFKKLQFVGSTGVALDENDMLLFMACELTTYTSLICTEKAAIETPGLHFKMQPDLYSALGWTWVWGIDADQQKTHLFIYDGIDRIQEHRFDFVAHDLAIGDINGHGFVVLSDPLKKELPGFMFKRGSSKHFTPVDLTINAANSGRHNFCPSNIQFDPNNIGILEVMNICNDIDKAVLRYPYPPGPNPRTGEIQVYLASALRIPYDFHAVEMCSFSDQIVLSTGPTYPHTEQYLFGFNKQSDLSSFTFGLNQDDFKIGTPKKFSCVQGAQGFSVFSTFNDSQKTTKYLSIFRGGEKYSSYNRISEVIREGLDDYVHQESFEFMNQFAHVLYKTNGEIDVMITFASEDIIKVTTNVNITKQLQNGVLPFTIKLRNGHINSSIDIHKNLYLIDPNTTTQTSVISRVRENEKSPFDLEKYVNFTGPVVFATTTDPESEVHLIERVSLTGSYHPSKLYQMKFETLQTSGKYMFALHKSPSNASTFNIFNENQRSLGLYTPHYSVKAFGFAPLSNITDKFLMVYATNIGEAHGVLNVALIDGTNEVVHTSIEDESTDKNFGKIEVLSIGHNNFAVVALNLDDRILHYYTCKVNNSINLSCKKNPDRNEILVFDFSVFTVENSDFFYVAVLQFMNMAELELHAFKKDDSSFAGIQEIQTPSKKYDFNIISVKTRAIDENHFYVLLAYFDAPVFIDITYNVNNFREYVLREYYTTPGYYTIPNTITVTENYICYSARSQGFSKLKTFFFKRAAGAQEYSTNATHYSLDVESASTPLALIPGEDEDIFVKATNDDIVPLDFYRVGHFKIRFYHLHNLAYQSLKLLGAYNFGRTNNFTTFPLSEIAPTNAFKPLKRASSILTE